MSDQPFKDLWYEIHAGWQEKEDENGGKFCPDLVALLAIRFDRLDGH